MRKDRRDCAFSRRMSLSEAYFQGPAMVNTESPGFAPVHSTRFATVPSGRHVSAETETTQTLSIVRAGSRDYEHVPTPGVQVVSGAERVTDLRHGSAYELHTYYIRYVTEDP